MERGECPSRQVGLSTEQEFAFDRGECLGGESLLSRFHGHSRSAGHRRSGDPLRVRGFLWKRGRIDGFGRRALGICHSCLQHFLSGVEWHQDHLWLRIQRSPGTRQPEDHRASGFIRLLRLVGNLYPRKSIQRHGGWERLPRAIQAGGQLSPVSRGRQRRPVDHGGRSPLSRRMGERLESVSHQRRGQCG